MRTRTLTLHNAGGTQLLSLLVRELEETSDGPLRNLEGVQPPASNKQAAWGDGLYGAGTLRRRVALCNIGSYSTLGHAKAALEVALLSTAQIRVDGWGLPIAASLGISSHQTMLTELQAVIELVPASAHWRYLTGPGSGTGSQAGTALTLQSLVAGDVGKLVEFANGREAIITAVGGTTSATADVDQTVASQSYTLYQAVTGLL